MKILREPKYKVGDLVINESAGMSALILAVNEFSYLLKWVDKDGIELEPSRHMFRAIDKSYVRA